MLFDLQSPGRRRFIKVIYGTLAALMGGGLVLFGIGGETSGGLLDGLGIGGDNSSGGGFEQQIEDAEAAAEAKPRDPVVVAELSRTYVLAGNQEGEVDEATGQVTPNEESAKQYEKAADAWDRYLKLNPPKPDSGVANLVVQAYFSLAQLSGSATEAQANLEGAAKAQQIAADATPSQGTYANLALYLYLSGETSAADAATAKAIAEAPPEQREQVRTQLAAFKKEGVRFQAQLKKEIAEAKKAGQTGAPGGATGSNPLSEGGGLGGGGLAPAP